LSSSSRAWWPNEPALLTSQPEQRLGTVRPVMNLTSDAQSARGDRRATAGDAPPGRGRPRRWRRSGPPSPAISTRPGASGPPRRRPRQATGWARVWRNWWGLRQVEAGATCEQSPHNASRPPCGRPPPAAVLGRQDQDRGVPAAMAKCDDLLAYAVVRVRNWPLVACAGAAQLPKLTSLEGQRMLMPRRYPKVSTWPRFSSQGSRPT
jgi:hypothetical protein